MSITPGMALRAAYDLREAAQAAIIAHYTNTGSTLQRAHLDELKSRFEQAAAELGYTLTPLKESQHVADTQDQPDGGRLNLSNESPAPFSENYGA